MSLCLVGLTIFLRYIKEKRSRIALKSLLMCGFSMVNTQIVNWHVKLMKSCHNAPSQLIVNSCSPSVPTHSLNATCFAKSFRNYYILSRLLRMNMQRRAGEMCPWLRARTILAEGQVWFPAPIMSSGSQLPVIPAPGDQIPLVAVDTFTHNAHARTQMDSHVPLKIRS